MSTLHEIYPGIFVVEVPLKGNPLKALNCYIIKDDQGAVVIDTGFNTSENLSIMTESLASLGVGMDQVKLVITHLHSDHSGLAGAMKSGGAEVLTGPVDGKILNEMIHLEYWEKFKTWAVMMDLVKDGIDFADHPGHMYCPSEYVDFTYMTEGDTLDIGPYRFEVLDIPGHTPGHIALYEPEHRLLFSGDHILDPISPNITFWGFEQDILQVFLDSLAKVRALPVDRVFAAHRRVIDNHVQRIDELIHHHEERLEEIEQILKDGWLSIRDTASRMEWSVRVTEWSDFPDPQKWFATGEAMSHLEHLYAVGKAERIEVEGVLKYRMKDIQ